MIKTIGVHPYENGLLTGSLDATVKLWNLDKSVKASLTYTRHKKPINSVCFTHCGNFAATCDSSIHVRSLFSLLSLSLSLLSPPFPLSLLPSFPPCLSLLSPPYPSFPSLSLLSSFPFLSPCLSLLSPPFSLSPPYSFSLNLPISPFVLPVLMIIPPPLPSSLLLSPATGLLITPSRLRRFGT